jgi:hypothetical protein
MKSNSDVSSKQFYRFRRSMICKLKPEADLDQIAGISRGPGFIPTRRETGQARIVKRAQLEISFLHFFVIFVPSW